MFNFIDIYSFIPVSSCVGMGLSALLWPGSMLLLRQPWSYCVSVLRYRIVYLYYVIELRIYVLRHRISWPNTSKYWVSVLRHRIAKCIMSSYCKCALRHCIADPYTSSYCVSVYVIVLRIYIKISYETFIWEYGNTIKYTNIYCLCL